MEKYFGEKQERFSFRKLSVGLVSATISSLFFMSVLASSSVEAQETKGVHYKYVTESELSSDEKKQLVYDIPTYMENDDETYYLVYKLNSQNQLSELPNTGSKNEMQALVAGASLAALGILIFAVSKKKVKNKTVLHLVLVAGIGNGVLISAHALENNLLLNYNTDYELTSGEKLPLPKDISGYRYVGYIKEGNITSEPKVNNQEKSAATPTKQQKVDYSVTPNFVDHPKVQDIQEEKTASSTKPTEVQVVEKPLSTELTNPRKEEKQSSDSQAQLAEHKNLETKKEEKNSPKEKTGVNTLNPQDEVLSGQLNKPELLYRDETIETKIDFQEEIQENPDLAEGTVRVKQEGKLGKKVEIVRIFSVNKEEVSREIVSTSTTAPVTRIVEKGTKKAQVIKEQPETGAEHKDVQSGAIVEPAVQPALPEAVVTDKGEPEVQPELPEAVVTEKGEPEVQPELPEAVVTDKGEPEVQPALPEAVVTDKGETEVQPESPDTVVSYKGEPEQVAPLPEYKGPQAGAIVEPEQVAPLPEYTGPQAGAVVEPAIQPELPEAVVTDKGEPEVQPALPEAVVTEKGEPAVQPELPEAVVTDKGETEVQPESPDTVVSDKGEPEQIAPLPEYTGVQAGAIVEPEQVEAPKEYTGVQAGAIVEPEKVEAPKEYTGVQAGAIVEPEQIAPLPEYTGPQAGAIVEPETVEAQKEYTGVQAGAIVEPEQVAPLPEYTGVQAGAIVEPEKVEAPKEYTGKIEQASAEETKHENEASPTNGEAERPKDKIKEEKQVDKKLELRNVSNVELYTVENNKYRHVTSLASVPTTPTDYFMKVKSENFKDVMLPVKSIESVRKDNQDVYKIVGQANDLIQYENNSTLENYTYYLPKTVSSENGVYTSFKNLVDAMNSNPHGTFRLGATIDAREVDLPDGKESYINHEFSGTLIGSNNDKNYAIYNLKKPLFNVLNHANIRDLSIKEVNVSSKEDAATIAKEASKGSKIINVHSSGVIAGERSIGGLVSQVDNSTISNSSFTGRITNTYDTKSTYQIGGLVGKLSGAGALIDRSVSSIDMATNANTGDQVVGGIAGVVDKKATISNSYTEGNLNNVKPFGKVGGVVGNLWDNSSSEVSNSGQITNVLSDVNVTNGNAIAGYNFDGIKATNTYSNKNNKVVKVVQVDDEILSKDSEEQRGTLLESNQVAEKKAELVPKKNTKIEDFNFSSRYETDYKNLKDADISRLRVYKNIEKLLPFYNRETIVKYGNLVDANNDLFTKELVSVVPMSDKDVITDINKDKQRINKLLLHYSDNTTQTLDIKYRQDFSKVAEYEITNTKLMYTPNTLLHNYNNIINSVVSELKSVNYNSDKIRKVLDISSNIKLTELYLDEQFEKTKANIEDSLSKLLSADAAVAENNNKIIDNYVIEKIKNNKEALLLGLTYLERWYNFNYGETNAKDLIMYHLDFFGKSNSSALDNVIELGRSGFNNLLAKNNVITYNVLLAKNYGTETLFKALEGYRKVFLPKTSNNEWFKKQTRAYIVEEKSTIEEVREKQGKEGTKYSIGVYDRLTSPSWKYQSMVLPLLTLPEEKMIFMIANISTIGFGAYDRYRSSDYPKGDKLNKFVEENAEAAAKRFRDHYDYWYKILDKENKEKLYRSVLVYDAFRFGNDKDNKLQEANFETNHPAIKNFFGPAGNNVVHNANGAYATGDAFYYMAYRMLDKSGAVTYTHEMTHNSDREIYLGGYGRRSGLGPEFYAKGLLQAPDHPNDPTITINSILKYEDSENSTRLQVADPTQQFNSAEDLRKYMHNLFDLVYTLEKLEGEAVVNLDTNEKGELLRKIENEYKPDPDGNEVYATNVVRRLNLDELNKLTSFNSLIENDIITRRKYINEGEYKRNGYYTINLFSPIYSALSSDKGTPGDLMGRRMAFELLAAKGYKEGMVPYISNQYEKEAKANGSKINSYGKEIGLVTDKLVLKKVFNDEYSSWVEFKKAMYKERENKFNKLSRISFVNPNNWGRQETITIDNIDKLRSIIREAVKKDAEDYRAQEYPDTNSRVYKLKKAIFKAYLDQTDDFRSSIFENKK
ncbi:ZmpA/ZmpB/ZmpC family metallo-endopeptidase [Streptococcus sp. 3851]|uniref:ZmpA/ZmpB/ZmpC family metallo-endopeptidase n=1 Tax=Streptococcus sp. 3851 TaxID=2582663 RepID=UPI0015633EE4|nr:ZmpA/ZmpB/ZmpC family metallo-endopeptidase [Streptococcus sp. 3851]